ncbi:small ribosomal subunit protein S13, mitochondrial-like [Fagus crenata]
MPKAHALSLYIQDENLTVGWRWLVKSEFHGVCVQCINIGGGKGEIPDNKRLQISLQHIHGIGRSRSRQILNKLSIEKKPTKELTGRELYALREELNNYMCAHELVNLSSSLSLRSLGVFSKWGFSHSFDALRKIN